MSLIVVRKDLNDFERDWECFVSDRKELKSSSYRVNDTHYIIAAEKLVAAMLESRCGKWICQSAYLARWLLPRMRHTYREYE